MNFTYKEIEELFEGIYDGKITKNDLPVNLYESISQFLSKGVDEGFIFDEVDESLLNELRTNVYMFGAAKTYQQVKDMSSLVADSKTFKEFKDAALKIYDKYNVDWLKSEYNTAIGQAQSASLWSDFEKNKTLFPNLRYRAVMDENTSTICRPLDGIVRPVDDPLWTKYAPLNHFNCRCILEKIDKYDDTKLSSDARVNAAKKQVETVITPEFAMNPGKTGYVFSDDHPYFKVSSEDKAFAKRNFDLPLPKEEIYKDIKIIVGSDLAEKMTFTERYELMKVSGIPTHFEGNVNINKNNEGQVKIHYRDAKNYITMIRIIDTKLKIIENEFFEIDSRSKYKGQGSLIFKGQVDAATKLGYKKIVTDAESGYFNGYYTWARLGYIPYGAERNGTIQRIIRETNLKNGINIKDFKELMGTKIGQEAWKKDGIGFHGTFDLTPGSYSQKTLQNYIDAKGKK